MTEPLNTYIEDHLAGAKSAVELLGALRDHHAGEPLGEFASTMLVEVEADYKVLQQLADQIGSAGSIKRISAWVAEKISRLKLGGGSSDSLGMFEALEFLALGVQGKLALWRALDHVKAGDDRLDHFDLKALITRAEGQFTQVEAHRLRAAQIALRQSEGSGVLRGRLEGS